MVSTLLLKISEPDNELRRINSGFYFAHSNEKMIRAFELITEHAAKSNGSEQPSFYHVLCGPEGEFRVGRSHCNNTEIDVEVKFLSRARSVFEALIK